MSERKATIVVDLGFGDAGKGTMVDYLARQGGVSAVVRFNGGAQARHNVVTPDGRHHGFSQFGSGSFVPGVRTHLSRYMLFDPVELSREAILLCDRGVRRPLSRISIDPEALVVTPVHKRANLFREALRRDKPHGTCGMGIGETMADMLSHPADAVRVGDLLDHELVAAKVTRVEERLRAELGTGPEAFFDHHAVSQWAFDTSTFMREVPVDVSHERLRVLAREGNLIFEGAQGVLIDEWRGFHPHTTWSTTTFDNALTLLREIGYQGSVEKLGVLRAYHVRHGEGPFPTENEKLTRHLPDPHNGNKGWQGTFRVGWLDTVLARYALAVCGGADSLALTHLDKLPAVSPWKVCRAYQMPGGEVVTNLPPNPALTDLSYQEKLTELLRKVKPLYDAAPGCDPDTFCRMIEQELLTPVTITSFGPTAGDKRQRTTTSIAA